MAPLVQKGSRSGMVWESESVLKIGSNCRRPRSIQGGTAMVKGREPGRTSCAAGRDLSEHTGTRRRIGRRPRSRIGPRVALSRGLAVSRDGTIAPR